MIRETQEGLAAKLGISFQQVQKYEKGATRVGASRLFAFAGILQVPIGFFFEGAPGADELPETIEDPEALANFTKTKEATNLNRAFSRIQSHTVRANLIRLANAAANAELHRSAGREPD